MTKRRAFTLLELLVVISIITLLIGILLPALSGAQKMAKQLQSNSRVKGIQNALYQYAQSNTQKYPGLGPDGTSVADFHKTSWRFKVLVDGQFIGGDSLISPVEATSKTIYTTGTMTSAKFSYALLQIQDTTNDAGRRYEWAPTSNSEAAVVSDRLSAGTAAAPQSVHSATSWIGSIAFNDGHVDFSASHVLKATMYGTSPCNNDNLFDTTASGTGSNANANAMMIYTE